ncbi:MAG TPA: DinB family protein [Gemmatimonadota bacterium]|nr:DinB family protein [Gemmatimonadota bacterium]
MRDASNEAASRDAFDTPALEAVRGELRAAGREAREMASGLEPRRLWWRPAPDRWSVGECLDHLVLTGEAYLPVLDETIADGRRRGLHAAGPHRRTLVGRWLPRLLEPPPGLRVTAPLEIRPRRPELQGSPREAPGPHGSRPAPTAPEGSRGDPLAAFLELRSRFRDRLAAADGLDLGRLRMASPFYWWIRFDLGSAFRIIAAHERRHLWQARQVVETEGFPAA